MKLTLPELSLVVLIGASGSGKSTFARQHFRPTEVLSSDVCRGLVADDENDQAATGDAFDVLHYIASKRLAAGRLTVVDATNVQSEARQPLVELARRYHCLPVAIVFNLPEALCHERNAQRSDRQFGPHVVRRHLQALRRSLRHLQREGFHAIHVLDSVGAVEAAVIERVPLWTNRRHETGPFDIIGDIHGCFDELIELLARLGYGLTTDSDAAGAPRYRLTPPPGRRLIFLGDLVDRGPRSVDVLRLVMAAVANGAALCLPGNHDVKLLRALQGRAVQRIHGLAETMSQLEAEPAAFRQDVARFLDGLIGHFVLDNGRLVVAHAGMKADLQGRASRRVRDFALYGETTGESDEFGLPVRLDWAADYRGRAMVVYGHTPVPEASWLNHTINIDTGCVFGGALTALRYPERELVAVPARQTYALPARPLQPATPTDAGRADDLLDLDDVLGKRLITTRLQPKIMIQADNASAALEVMSRFAIDPRWLIYLPPTMSPCETSQQAEWLEYPTEAFDYYRQQGVTTLICEEKHMGSRAVVIVGRNGPTLARRFGGDGQTLGMIYTRTGRRFFDDPTLEQGLLGRLSAALTATDFWATFQSDWAALDCELMPWSAKAQELLRRQYAAVGVAGAVGLAAANAALTAAAERGLAVGELQGRLQTRAAMVDAFQTAYGHYCWPVTGLADLKLAPFQLLASEGTTHLERPHHWHMAWLAELAAADRAAQPASPVLLATGHQLVDLSDAASEQAATEWWLALTRQGGEGMVVKPDAGIVRGPHGLVQPGIKVRGREYLRIIYGPEYSAPEHLDRLRQRGLGRKRALAHREYALGVEALERFVAHEPLYRVHECVFAILALESEPVDPRL